MIFMIGLLGCQCSGNWSTLTSLFAELAAFRQAGPCQAGRNDALRLGPAWVADGLMRWWLSRPMEHWNIYGSPIPNPPSHWLWLPTVGGGTTITVTAFHALLLLLLLRLLLPLPLPLPLPLLLLLILLLLLLLLLLGKNGKGFSSFFIFFYRDVVTQMQHVPFLSLPPVSVEGFDIWRGGPPGCAGFCSGSPALVSGLRYAAMELSVWVFVLKLTALSLYLSLEDQFGRCSSTLNFFEFVWSHSDHSESKELIIFWWVQKIWKHAEHHHHYPPSGADVKCKKQFRSAIASLSVLKFQAQWLRVLTGVSSGCSCFACRTLRERPQQLHNISPAQTSSQSDSWQLNQKCLDWLVLLSVPQKLKHHPRGVKMKWNNLTLLEDAENRLGTLLVIQCRYGPPRLSCADATETSPALIPYSPSAACSNEGLRTRPGQMRTNEPEKTKWLNW